MQISSKLTALAAVGALALTMAACGGGGAGSTDGSGTITIGVKEDQPGVGLREGNTRSGFDVETAKYVARELGYAEDKINFVAAPSAQRENLITSGQVQLVFASYSITDERKKTVSFGGPYFIAGQDLLVRAEDTAITGPDSLNGKKLCSVTGSTSAKKIKDNYAGQVQLLERDGYSACVEALTSSAVDAVTTDNVILAGYAAQTQYAGKLKLVGQPFSEERYGVGLRKGDTELCGKVNAALEKMVTDGTWQKNLDATVGPSGFKPDTATNPPKPDACS